METAILELLNQNARISIKEIAQLTGNSEDAVQATIADLENRQIIQGYATIINEEALPNRKVRAIIEVKVTPKRDGGFDAVARRLARYEEVTRLYLVSGGYDLLLELEGETLQEVATFVSEKLATVEGVLSCNTAFQLKKYKESGHLMMENDEYERLQICP